MVNYKKIEEEKKVSQNYKKTSVVNSKTTDDQFKIITLLQRNVELHSDALDNQRIVIKKQLVILNQQEEELIKLRNQIDMLESVMEKQKLMIQNLNDIVHKNQQSLLSRFESLK